MVMRIGVLALQGDFVEHERALARIGVEPVQVRLPQHLGGLDGLILPGGESTTIGRLIERWGLLEPIRALARSGRPLWGTCAGTILMAREVSNAVPGQTQLALMDMRVQRNAYGRQVDSFEADLRVPLLGDEPFHAVFIRAPTIQDLGPTVQVLALVNGGMPVAVRQGTLMATTFHPELVADDRFHRYFAGLCHPVGTGDESGGGAADPLPADPPPL
jgi:5'-phosphate synthase pdxT subunit